MFIYEFCPCNAGIDLFSKHIFLRLLFRKNDNDPMCSSCLIVLRLSNKCYCKWRYSSVLPNFFFHSLVHFCFYLFFKAFFDSEILSRRKKTHECFDSLARLRCEANKNYTLFDIVQYPHGFHNNNNNNTLF